MHLIETKNLTHIYSKGTPYERAAISDISITIDKGEVIGIIGATGSGKSTLIQHLNGLLKPTSGSVIVNGRDIWDKGADMRSLRFTVGLVFQYPEYQLFEETVYRDIAFGPTNMGLSKDEIDERVRAAAAFTGVTDDMLQMSPFELSGGQKRRVAIAGVIAMRPEVLVLDEPTAGLDPRGRKEILKQLFAYQKESGGTVLLVSHSMEEVAKYADRVLVLDEGRVFSFDTTDGTFRRAGDLMRLGLAVPSVTRIFSGLRKKGIDVPEDVFTMERAKEELLKLFGGEA